MASLATVCTLLAFAASPALLAGCGGDDATTTSRMLPASTITETTAPPTGAGAGAATATSEGPRNRSGEDGDRPQPGSGTAAPSALVAAEAVLTGAGTPEQACASYVTEGFIRNSYGGEENCIAARRGRALAESISPAPGSEEDSTDIVVVPDGGPYDGAKVEVGLVAEEGGFRVDRLDAHVPAGP